MPTPIVRIIAIGDELVLGRHVDTNSSWIARWAHDRGFSIGGFEVISDDEGGMCASFRRAMESGDFILITGGLGPTDDDRTRHVLARATGRELIESPRAMAMVTKTFERLRRPMSPSNKRQALAPKGATIVPNDRGTAPGLLLKHKGAVVVCMPGVPHEMKAMCRRLEKRLPALFPLLKPLMVEEIYFSGLGESSAQDLLGDLLGATHPTVGITAHDIGHITIRIVGLSTQVKKRAVAIRKKLAQWLIPHADIAASVIQVLRNKALVITTAESCTCGVVVERLGRIAGASHCLEQGLVAYSNKVKVAQLGVEPALLKSYGAVSQEAVEAMAEGALEHTDADISVATTGIAGPGGGSKAKPVGTVWIAAAYKSKVMSKCIFIPGDRHRVQNRAACGALQLVWELLHPKRFK